ncbi:MAG: hypothetical protein AAF766_24470, partial [Cyanobacteria bacterium P01_D01_bin.14]
MKQLLPSLSLLTLLIVAGGQSAIAAEPDAIAETDTEATEQETPSSEPDPISAVNTEVSEQATSAPAPTHPLTPQLDAIAETQPEAAEHSPPPVRLRYSSRVATRTRQAPLSPLAFSRRETLKRTTSLSQPATTVDEWLIQIAQAELVEITNVQVEETAEGFTLRLETNGELATPITSVT